MTATSRGVLDLNSSQSISIVPAVGVTLTLGVSPAASYNEAIFCGTVGTGNVAAFFQDSGLTIGLSSPICGGSTLTFPFDFGTTPICSLENQWVTFQVFDPIDQSGNPVDTTEWAFYIDFSADPTLDFVVSNLTGAGLSDRSIDMTILEGALPYTIQWETSSGDTIFGGPLVDSTDLQDFLPEGTYYVTVTDGNCSVVSDSVVLSGPSACVTSTPPQNPIHTQLATRMQLDWDALPQSVACQVHSTRISPAGPTGKDARDRTLEVQETGQLAPGMYRSIVRGSPTIPEPFVKVE